MDPRTTAKPRGSSHAGGCSLGIALFLLCPCNNLPSALPQAHTLVGSCFSDFVLLFRLAVLQFAATVLNFLGAELVCVEWPNLCCNLLDCFR